jgi:hypothetical protein
MAAPKPIWVRQAEEAKLKSEAETTAAKANFRVLSESAHTDQPPKDPEPSSSPAQPASFPALRAASSNSDSDLRRRRPSPHPAGSLRPCQVLSRQLGNRRCLRGEPATFTVVGKDLDGRRVTYGGARVSASTPRITG